jgi:Cdc6-like AAA superfamily ATPase
MANSIIVVGRTGSGKTHYLRKSILPNQKNYIIFDLYGNEYTDLNLPDINKISQYKGGKCRLVLNKKLFDNAVDFVDTFWSDLSKLNNTTFIMEDATIFLPAQQDKRVMQLLIEKRHPNMSYVWLFHSVAQIPPYIYRGSNAIRLGKTNDLEKNVIQKFEGNEKLLRAFLEVKKSSNQYENRFIKL